MGPHRRLEVLLLGAAALLLLPHPTTAYVYTKCPAREQFHDDIYGCVECKRCPRDSRQQTDFTLPMKECQDKNLYPLNDTIWGNMSVGLWCYSESTRVKDRLRELTPTTTTTQAPTTVTFPTTTITRTTGQQETTQGENYGAVAPSTTGNEGLRMNPYTILGVTIPIFVLLVAFGAFCLVWKYRGRRSASSLSSSEPSTEASTPLTGRSGMDSDKCDIERGGDEGIDDAWESTYPITSNPSPRPSEVKITAIPGCYINEGYSLQLDVSHAWKKQSVVWFHDRTGTVHIGPTISFDKIAYFQRGTYLACNCSDTASITIEVFRSSRLGTENDEPEPVLIIREPTEIGPEAVETPFTIGLPGIEGGRQLAAITYQPTDAITQPQNSHGATCFVTSGQIAGQIYHVVNALDSLLTQVDEGQQRPPSGCTLLLSTILQNEEAMQQLAVLADTSSTWRIFAATKGNMSVDEIEFIRYRTHGTGNTVKGLFEYIIKHKNGGRLTAADFSTSLRDAGWQGCDKIIHLLFRLHTDCTVCQMLQNSHGQTQMEFDASLQNQIPGYQYHLNNRKCHCSQTLRDLTRKQCYSEAFRQESRIYFCQGELPIWIAVGSHLGGMSTERLRHMEHHYRADCYLKMLDFFVELCPTLKVGTLAEWLHNHHHSSARDIVLKYHRMHGDCSYCRQFEAKSS